MATEVLYASFYEMCTESTTVDMHTTTRTVQCILKTVSIYHIGSQCLWIATTHVPTETLTSQDACTITTVMTAVIGIILTQDAVFCLVHSRCHHYLSDVTCTGACRRDRDTANIEAKKN